MNHISSTSQPRRCYASKSLTIVHFEFRESCFIFLLDWWFYLPESSPSPILISVNNLEESSSCIPLAPHLPVILTRLRSFQGQGAGSYVSLYPLLLAGCWDVRCFPSYINKGYECCIAYRKLKAILLGIHDANDFSLIPLGIINLLC